MKVVVEADLLDLALVLVEEVIHLRVLVVVEVHRMEMVVVGGL